MKIEFEVRSCPKCSQGKMVLRKDIFAEMMAIQITVYIWFECDLCEYKDYVFTNHKESQSYELAGGEEI